jgi:hypothetical protein
MKKNFTLFAFCLFTYAAFAQMASSLDYTLSLPQQAMAKNIQAVHQLSFNMGYRLPNYFRRVTVGAEVGIGTYANLRMPTTFNFEGSPPTNTHVNYSSNTYKANVVVSMDLADSRSTLIPYVVLKGGVHSFFSGIRVEDPNDDDGCHPLESKSIIKDITTAWTYGGGVRYQIFKNRYFSNYRKHYLNIQVTNTRGGTIDYINTKKLTEHQHHTSTQITNNDESFTPVEMKFINVKSNVIHNHMIAELYSTPLRLLDIRVGYYIAF